VLYSDDTDWKNRVTARGGDPGAQTPCCKWFPTPARCAVGGATRHAGRGCTAPHGPSPHDWQEECLLRLGHGRLRCGKSAGVLCRWAATETDSLEQHLHAPSTSSRPSCTDSTGRGSACGATGNAPPPWNQLVQKLVLDRSCCVSSDLAVDGYLPIGRSAPARSRKVCGRTGIDLVHNTRHCASISTNALGTRCSQVSRILVVARGSCAAGYRGHTHTVSERRSEARRQPTDQYDAALDTTDDHVGAAQWHWPTSSGTSNQRSGRRGRRPRGSPGPPWLPRTLEAKALIISVARRPRQSHHNIVTFVEYRSRYRSASRLHQRQPTQ
jgi:hypothetical protein